MAQITIVPHGHNEFEVVCGAHKVRVVVPQGNKTNGKDGSSSEPGDADSSGRGGVPPVGDAGSAKPGPVFVPPPFLPLFAAPIGSVSLTYLARASGPSQLAGLVQSLLTHRGGRPQVPNETVVVELPESVVNLDNLHSQFARLGDDTKVTVILVPTDGRG
jgi:hypothetical protein